MDYNPDPNDPSQGYDYHPEGYDDDYQKDLARDRWRLGHNQDRTGHPSSSQYSSEISDSEDGNDDYGEMTEEVKTEDYDEMSEDAAPEEDEEAMEEEEPQDDEDTSPFY